VFERCPSLAALRRRDQLRVLRRHDPLLDEGEGGQVLLRRSVIEILPR
jgi:hypothetical protein